MRKRLVFVVLSAIIAIVCTVATMNVRIEPAQQVPSSTFPDAPSSTEYGFPFPGKVIRGGFAGLQTEYFVPFVAANGVFYFVISGGALWVLQAGYKKFRSKEKVGQAKNTQ